MSWGFNARVDAAEARAARAEEKVRLLEEQLTRERETAAAALQAAEEDRRKLLDRLLQLSGQPALYEKPVAPVMVPQSTSDLPEVPPLIRFDDIHKAARTAMQEGTFKVPKRA